MTNGEVMINTIESVMGVEFNKSFDWKGLNHDVVIVFDGSWWKKENQMNSKQKGSRGERMLRDVWRSHGYTDAHRSQQYSGKGESSADIEGIDPLLHIECKVGYTYKTIYDFMDQAVSDSKEGQIPVVNCKMDRKEWLCVMRLDDFIELWKEKQ